MKKVKILGIILIFVALVIACQKDKIVVQKTDADPTPVDFVYPGYFPPPEDFSNNPLTKEGIALGRHLFYDPVLSADSTQACASCHLQQFNFSDTSQFSTGIDGLKGDKNAMAIVNMAWQNFFFWNGRDPSLEAQAIQPVRNPIEMHNTWQNVVVALKQNPKYVEMFGAAFGEKSITKENAAKAIAQFERTLMSANSKYDQGKLLNPQFSNFTGPELLGYEMFNSEVGDCFHCHAEPLFGAYGSLQFSNNGLDSGTYVKPGRMAVTGNADDRGKFKIPTLRNVEWSFPYMHDGRFTDLFQVIEHYNSGGHWSPTIDPNMKAVGVGKGWSPAQKDALIAFMKTLTDYEFLGDTAHASPF